MFRIVAFTVLVNLGLAVAATAADSFKAVEKLRAGMPLPQVRSILLEGGWTSDTSANSPGRDGCIEQAELCAKYPELGSCWFEQANWFCGLVYVDADPLGSVLTVKVRIDPKAGPVYVDYDEMAKGGFG